MIVLLAFAFLLGADSLGLAVNHAGQVARNKPEIVAYVTVTDAEGNRIAGLTTENFLAREDRDTIRQFTVQPVSERDAISIGMLLDNSGSMKYFNKLDRARGAAAEFVQQIGDSDRVWLYKVADQASLVSDTNSRQALTDAIGMIEAEGSRTVFFDGLHAILKEAKNLPRKRMAVIALTDGKDEGSSVLLQDVLDLAAETKVPIYTIAFGRDAVQQPLQRIASLTGGHYYFAPRSDDLLDVYRTIAAQLKIQYRIDYRTRSKELPSRNLLVGLHYRGATAEDSYRFVVSLADDRRMRLIMIGGLIFALAIVIAVLVNAWSRRKAAIPVAVGAPKPWPTSPVEPPGPKPADTLTDISPLTAPIGPAGPRPMPKPIEGPVRSAQTVILKPPEALKALLVVKAGPNVGQTHGLRTDSKENELRVGRNPDNDFVIPDESVSRYHLKIRYRNDNFELWDLASTGGTFLNGERVSTATALKDGDTIRLANRVELVFKDVREEHDTQAKEVAEQG